MLWWREVSCLSVHLSDTTGSVLGFLRRQGFPIGFSGMESNQNADLMLVSVFLAAFSDCVHVELNLGADVRADIKTCRRLLVADTSPLTSHFTSDFTLHLWPRIATEISRGHLVRPYISLCVTCTMKANEEATIFRTVSVNQGWRSHQHAWVTYSIQAVAVAEAACVRGVQCSQSETIRTCAMLK